MEKNQRIVAFYILYEAYHHESNIKATPFEAVVYNCLQACTTEIQLASQSPAGTQTQEEPSPFSAEASFRAEFKLLSDFLVSVPRIKNEKVGKFILDAETPLPIDTSTYVANFEQALPKLKGAKAYAIPGILRDLPEVKNAPETTAFVGTPRHGVSSAADIYQEELQSHYFTPNILRPMPEAEEDPEIDGFVYDFS